MVKKVYVDWEKIELLIKSNQIDLSEYGNSKINYLSEKTGRPWSTIKRVQDEQTTTLKTIGQLAAALRCHPVDIISAVGYPAPKLNAPVVLSTTESLSRTER